MAEFNSGDAYDKAMAEARSASAFEGIPGLTANIQNPEMIAETPADSFTVSEPTPVAEQTKIPTGAGQWGEPDTDAAHAEGFDEVLHGYGAVPSPTPPPAPAPSTALQDVGSPEWVAEIRMMHLTDSAGLRQYLLDYPEHYAEVNAVITGAPLPSAAPVSSNERDDVEDIPADKPRAIDRDDVAKTGWRGWIARRLNLPIGKSRAELTADDLDMAADCIRQVLDHIYLDDGTISPLVIGVTSFKGGCGKTRMSVALAKIIAEILDEILAPEDYLWRGHQWRGSVVAIDTDMYGMLRACAQEEQLVRSDDSATMTTLCARLASGYRPDQIDINQYIHEVDHGFSFSPGNRTGERAQLSAEGVYAAMEVLKAHFPVIVVDMSQVGNTEHYAAVLRSLTGLMMVTPPSLAEVSFLDGTRNMLSSRPPEGLGAEHLIMQRITVINNTSRAAGSATHADVAAKLKLHEASGAVTENPRGSDVAEVPFDRQISSHLVVDPATMHPATRYGVQMAAGALIDTTLNLSNRE